MWNSINVSHLVTVLVALAGWFAVHRLSAWRDRANHNRKIRTEFLITAFQKLGNAANRHPTPGSQYFRDTESAVVDLQLFGSTSQIQMVDLFTKEFGETRKASLDPLLNSLRSELRRELGYEQVDLNVKWLRLEGSPDVSPNAALNPDAEKRGAR